MRDIQYLGHSAFLVDLDPYRIIIDPFLTGNPLAPASARNQRVTHILVTHGHGDHLGDALELARTHDAEIIAPYELALYAQEKGARVHPMHIGGAFHFPFGRVKLTMALHGSMTPDGRYAGNPCGFLLQAEGRTLYHAGDTGLFGDMKLLGDLHRPDLALLPIGDNFTMGVQDALVAARLLQARLCIPMHFDTFPVIQSDPLAFVQGLEAQGQKGTVLKPGDILAGRDW